MQPTTTLTSLKHTETVTPELADKERRLLSLIKSYGSAIVAYSGGVDSTYLAAAAHDALGTRALIATAQSPSMAESEFEFAARVANERGWNLRVVKTAEADDPRWLRNDLDRCYFCKSELFTVLEKLAAQEKIARILYGAIPEDQRDIRPGQRAATEFQVAAPLAEIGINKPEIRALSRARSLPSWDKPQAACLASRFPTGTVISVEELRQIDRAEAALARLGFRGHRVRHHGVIARIELQSADWARINDAATRQSITQALKAIGYKHVTVDLAGYKPAGLNQ
ncbi:MAG: ATP-dependent sacrificial sulfur transferase LarE [candidate division Zixibacteria bacterium]|nr:ATP-dependent sacrificial sulfur transferase LarE [candidate division Zixibacteria bacterium]